MTLEDNSSGWLLCGRVHAVTSLMNNVKMLLLQPQAFIDLDESVQRQTFFLLSLMLDTVQQLSTCRRISAV